MLVPARDHVDPGHGGGPPGSEGGDEVGEAAAQVRHLDVRGVQGRGPGDDRGVEEVALPETARRPAQALAVHLDGRAHLAQGRGEAEAVLVDGLVHDGQPVGLREGDDQGLLPVRHEARVDGGLQGDGVEALTGVVEADAVGVDVEGAPHLAEGVEEGRHVGLEGAAHVDVAVRGQGGGGPRGGLDAVGQRRVAVAAQFPDALDADRAVRVDGDDRAHLLQDVDEVHDLGLDGGAPQRGDALVAHGGEQGLLRGAHGGEGQLDDGAVQARGGAPDAHAVGALVHDGPELAQRVEVEVDGAAADGAAAELGDERLAELVEQGAAEEDRDARGAGQCVDVGARGDLDVRGVQHHRAAVLVEVGGHAVQAQQVGDDVDIADQGDVVELGRGVGQQGGHHRLGHEVLRAAHCDLPAQWVAALDSQHR